MSPVRAGRRPGSDMKRRAGGLQLYKSLSFLCLAALLIAAMCEGYLMAQALRTALTFHAIAHGVSR